MTIPLTIQFYSKRFLNGIHDSPVLKENIDNDIDKAILVFDKYQVQNEESTSYHSLYDLIQSREDKNKRDIERNNSVPSSPSNSQTTRCHAPSRNKNVLFEADVVASSNSPTELQQLVRKFEIAVGVSNERHRTLSEIEILVDNNLPMHASRDLSHDRGSHLVSIGNTSTESHDPTLNVHVSQVENEAVATNVAADDEEEETKLSEAGEDVFTTSKHTQLTSESEALDSCDEIETGGKDDWLCQIPFERNPVEVPSTLTVSPQQQSHVTPQYLFTDKPSIGDILPDTSTSSRPCSQVRERHLVWILQDDSGKSFIDNYSPLPIMSSKELVSYSSVCSMYEICAYILL